MRVAKKAQKKETIPADAAMIPEASIGISNIDPATDISTLY